MLNYDITAGFVLDADKAIDYIKEAAAGFYNEAIELGEGYLEAIEDCIEMARQIKAGGWSWVLFREHPMAPSQFTIEEVKSAEARDKAGDIVAIASQRLDNYAPEIEACTALHPAASMADLLEARARAERFAEGITEVLKNMAGAKKEG